MNPFIPLNILRVITIISLLLMGVASLVIVIKGLGHFANGSFFQVVNHLFLVIEIGILIVSEIELLQDTFERVLPLIGPKSTLLTLGMLQV